MTSRAPVSAQSVDNLNKLFAADPVLGLRVVNTLVHDPSNWDQLFALDEEHKASLADVQERSRTAPMSRLVKKTSVFMDDLSQVTIVIITPETGVPTIEAESDNPWFVPDKVEVKVTGDTDGKAKVEASVTWTF